MGAYLNNQKLEKNKTKIYAGRGVCAQANLSLPVFFNED